MASSIDAQERGIWQSLTFTSDANSNQSEYRGDITQKNKSVYDKPTTNIMTNSDTLKASPLKSQTEGCPLSSLLLNTLLEILAQQSYKKKIIQIRMKKILKLSLFADYKTLYI